MANKSRETANLVSITGISTLRTEFNFVNGPVQIGSAVTITSGGIVAGLSTITNFRATHINSTGIGTFATAIVGSAVTITAGGIVAGLGTVNSINATHINISGVTTVSAGSASAPSISPTGDSNTGIFFPAADTIAFGEGGSEAARIDSSGRLGIGTASPQHLVHLSSSSSSNYLRIDGLASRSFFGYETKGTVLYAQDQNGNASALSFNIGSSEVGRFDDSGKLGIGTASPIAPLHISADSEVQLILNRATTTTGASYLRFTNGGGNYFIGADSSAGNRGFASGGAPYGLVIVTESAYPVTIGTNNTERMRINTAGDLLVNRTNPAAGNDGVRIASTGFTEIVISNDAPLSMNRRNSDGNLVILQESNVTEGTISVSGTTVSYNGAHLSRWSQLPSGAEREEILRGSVLSNIDEMCEWGDEENEQLNRMKVSDVEGDKNVSGVFQCWDDDDDTYTNDFYCAMTGDFIIRIAEGVTVERGDLLMSAGDGTAKPQDDDIIRSKTIAKVTSTNVTCTYDDGSYCVPCVLMAC